MPSARQRSLEVHEDLPFERRQWRIQRVSWCAMALVLLLALLGLFGNGPLSTARAQTQGLRVEYDRFVHANAPTTLHLFVAPSGGTVRFAVNRAYLETMPIEHIRPAPARVAAVGDTLALEFAAGGAREVEIAMDLRPQRAGRPMAEIRQMPGIAAPALRFRQLVYP